jgi:AcrR family transcriptional regulator
VVSAPTGRREASKQATSAALRAAAMRLFAEQGYDATTVADIARAARVTHRTFYRYFDSKEALLSHEFGSWLTMLAGAIHARPAAEPPVTAVRRAMLSVSQQASAEPAPAPLWLFADQPARAGLRRAGPRPLLRLEATITEAVLDRRGAGRAATAPADSGEEFQAQVIGRVAVAAFRSAVIYHRYLTAQGESASPGVERLLDQAFAVIGGQDPDRKDVV